MGNWLKKNGWRVEKDEKGMDFIHDALGISIRCEGSELPWDDLDFTNYISNKDSFEIARYYFNGDLGNSEVGICLSALLADFVEMFLYERLVNKSIAFKWDIEIEEDGKVMFTHLDDVIVVNLVDDVIVVDLVNNLPEEEDVEVIKRLFYRLVGEI